ncbi:uncharacterized protein BJ171DRAFT_112789 [Polychytrium aggregatum]|uniref:uncharacterized protein n=1 Tax=Polychytrium aggregatum TaxID=110093 RepID=UPI0022FDEF0D|nr:uncharacterized protein BJ171DRAFT_112789 [Polychytrium aggregatum]KAI9209297.1 hypothetical protein BJ171DRAFT_112789 [Polychytrium aggregatum]
MAYQTQLLNLREDFAGYIATKDSGWTQDALFRFEKIRQEYTTGHILRRQLLTDRLHLEYPSVSDDRLKRVGHFLQQHSLYKKQLQCLKESILRKSAQLLSNHIQEAQVKEMEEAKQQQASALMRHQLEYMESLHRILREWRKTKIEYIKAEEAQREAEMAERLMLESERESKRKSHQLALRLKIEQYHNENRAKEVEESRRNSELQEQRRHEREAQEKHDKERVAYREGLLAEKAEINKRKQAEREEERRSLEEKLDRLRAMVAVHVESNWERILKATGSAGCSRDTDQAEQLPGSVAHGYSMDDLLKDPRAKLAMALHQHGLQHSEYGRNIIVQMPSTVLPHMRSAIGSDWTIGN